MNYKYSRCELSVYESCTFFLVKYLIINYLTVFPFLLLKMGAVKHPKTGGLPTNSSTLILALGLLCGALDGGCELRL